MNPFECGKPCIIIARRELLFEKYRIDLKREKHDIEVQNYDAIRRNQMFFDFMQQMFNHRDRLYLHLKSLFIERTIENQSRKQSAAEVKILNRKKRHKQKKLYKISKCVT